MPTAAVDETSGIKTCRPRPENLENRFHKELVIINNDMYVDTDPSQREFLKKTRIEADFLIDCSRPPTNTEPTQPPIYPSSHPRSMLYKPIYIKGTRVMHETLIPIGRPIPSPPPEPQAPNLPEPPVEEEDEIVTEDGEGLKRLPMLISRYKLVVPPEATRDVLAGRVPYLLVENDGVTVFRPVHVFAALKLKKETVERLEDYRCVGAHERILDKKPTKRVGLGYRRKYISPELIGKGIFDSYGALPQTEMLPRIKRTQDGKKLKMGFLPLI